MYRKDFRFCIVCLLFNINLRQAAPLVFILNCITPWTSASEINEWKIQLPVPSSGEIRELIWDVTLTVHYGDYRAVECTSVVHLFLQCIVGLNESTREHPLWFYTDQTKFSIP